MFEKGVAFTTFSSTSTSRCISKASSKGSLSWKSKILFPLGNPINLASQSTIAEPPIPSTLSNWLRAKPSWSRASTSSRVCSSLKASVFWPCFCANKSVHTSMASIFSCLISMSYWNAVSGTGAWIDFALKLSNRFNFPPFSPLWISSDKPSNFTLPWVLVASTKGKETLTSPNIIIFL